MSTLILEKYKEYTKSEKKKKISNCIPNPSKKGYVCYGSNYYRNTKFF